MACLPGTQVQEHPDVPGGVEAQSHTVLTDLAPNCFPEWLDNYTFTVSLLAFYSLASDAINSLIALQLPKLAKFVKFNDNTYYHTQ